MGGGHLLQSVTQVVVARFLKQNIICRYVMPRELITNNEKNLNGKMIESSALPTGQDQTLKFGSLPPLDEWRSGSNQQKHKEDLSEDDRHLYGLAEVFAICLVCLSHFGSYFHECNLVFLGLRHGSHHPRRGRDPISQNLVTD